MAMESIPGWQFTFLCGIIFLMALSSFFNLTQKLRSLIQPGVIVSVRSEIPIFMADTSKQTDSPCLQSSSSFKFWDVFLSFGGKDTRRSFIGHLYSALDQAGIRTFKDEPGLERGEEIAPQLIKAIHDSKMSIVVFSKNYASSKWCLNELTEIHECERTRGQIVLPVFYDVDPLNVRHQTESYAKAFEKHKIRHAEKVDTWRAALTATANISGYDLKNDANGHEADLIQKIVNDVLMKLCPKNLNVTEHQVGIDSRVKEICQKLSIGSNDVRFIGIYGMPGIGKTTIGKALYNKIYKKFEGSCFLENVREAFEEPRGLHYLLDQLIFQLLKIKDFKVTSVDTGISFVKQRLRSKKVLIVLDDLDEIKQLESLAGNWNWFGPGSRIIVTTRDSRLLVECQVDLMHEVEELNGNESLKLFRRHAFRNTTPMKNLMELSKDIVKYVGGLPLALEVLGSSLFDRPMVQWESVFGKLKKIPHKDIQKKLRISYVALGDDIVRDIFLDIACFFIGMDKDNAIKILDACGFFPEIGITNLRERCLLKIDWSNKLRMHNLIQDMGREIVREESVKNPRKRSRLWFHEDAYDVLKNFKGQYENIEGIRLVMPTEKKVDISTRAFHSLPNLRLLQISNVNLTGSFEHLFEELRWFCWNYSSLDCLPSSFQAPKLVFLDMQHSKVNILWEGTKQLQGLKILNASYSPSLKTTPDFKGLESLERLILQGCSSLSRIHPSIGLLHNLVHLDLNECYSLNQLPEQLGNMRCIRKLSARHSRIEQLPDSIKDLGNLEKLDLDGCKDLRNLPSSICNLTSLVHLGLSCCSNLESLPENLGNISSLMDLDVCATNIMQLPDSIRFLTRLKNLNISFCKRLMNTRRRIYNPSSLQTLPSNLSQLVNSEDLDVSNRLSRQSLLKLPPNLEQLFANDCTSLDILPDMSGMKHLTRLAFIECSSLQSLPKLPPNLITLKLSNCTSFQFLLELPLSLQTLELINCPSLQSLPKFPPLDLRKVYLTNCTCLESLPELPPVLCELDLNNCTNLKSLPELPTDFIRLSLTNCTSLESLPELPTDLLILNLTNCTSLESLPELPTELVVLNLTNYTSLESLPELPLDLRILYLINWSSLESLPELPPDLEVLYLNNCNKLLSVPKLPPNLKDLRLINCTSLRSLPKLPCKLGYLDLTDCNSLESLQELPCHLDYLKASGCKSLQKLPDLSNLTNLSTLILTDCSDLISNFIRSVLRDCSVLDDCEVYI